MPGSSESPEVRPVSICFPCTDSGTGRCRVGVATTLSWTTNRVVCGVVCPAGEAGGPTVAQGGWIAKVFDEVMAQVPIILGRGGITKELTVRYRKPVPIERELEIEAWVSGEDGRYTMVSAELRLAGVVLAASDATFVRVDIDTYYRQHEEWLAENG